MLAARAAASFVLANESNSALLKHFADLLPGVLQVRPSSSDILDDDVNQSPVVITAANICRHDVCSRVQCSALRVAVRLAAHILQNGEEERLL